MIFITRIICCNTLSCLLYMFCGNTCTEYTSIEVWALSELRAEPGASKSETK